MPIYWHEGIKLLTYNDYYFIEKNIFEKFHYPNSTMIESNELKKGQPQNKSLNLILEKIEEIKNQFYPKKYGVTSIEFINPNILLEKNHNIVSVNVKIANFEFPIDFHINLVNN